MAAKGTPKGLGIPFRFDSTGYPAPCVGDTTFNNSIFTILSTFVGERVHQPTFGCFLKRLIFENVNAATGARATAEVRRALAQWEKRVTVTEVSYENSTDTVKVNVKWIANNSIQGTTTIPITITPTGA